MLEAIIGAVVGAIGGGVAMYFVMRNNPKYFHVDDMLKSERDKALGRVDAIVKILKDKGIAMTDEYAEALKNLLR